jgi:DNA-directed RNA polymerase specialized sigma24 family protein
MNTALQEAALTQTYQDVEKLLYQLAWQFHNTYGGDIRDWHSEAHLFFMKAYYSYNNDKSKFTTWVHHCVRGGLRDYLKKFISKNQPSTVDTEGNDYMLLIPDTSNPFSNVIDLLDEVKDDGKLILRLIWGMPEDLKSSSIKKGKSGKHTKILVKKYLLKLGWTHNRIKDSFKEIGEALYA